MSFGFIDQQFPEMLGMYSYSKAVISILNMQCTFVFKFQDQCIEYELKLFLLCIKRTYASLFICLIICRDLGTGIKEQKREAREGKRLLLSGKRFYVLNLLLMSRCGIKLIKQKKLCEYQKTIISFICVILKLHHHPLLGLAPNYLNLRVLLSLDPG